MQKRSKKIIAILFVSIFLIASILLIFNITIIQTPVITIDIDVIELNEAFAAQTLAVISKLKIDPGIVNVNGGAVALGHPIGASGARIVVTLAYEMLKRKVEYGLASLCIGSGEGMAIILKRV